MVKLVDAALGLGLIVYAIGGAGPGCIKACNGDYTPISDDYYKTRDGIFLPVEEPQSDQPLGRIEQSRESRDVLFYLHRLLDNDEGRWFDAQYWPSVASGRKVIND